MKSTTRDEIVVPTLMFVNFYIFHFILVRVQGLSAPTDRSSAPLSDYFSRQHYCLQIRLSLNKTRNIKTTYSNCSRGLKMSIFYSFLLKHTYSLLSKRFSCFSTAIEQRPDPISNFSPSLRPCYLR